MDSAVYPLFKERKTAVLTIDKPGITVDRAKISHHLDWDRYLKADLKDYIGA